jgi:transposase
LPPLEPEIHDQLLARFNQTGDADERLRYQIVLLSSGKQLIPTEIAALTFRSHDTVTRVLSRFLEGGLDAVPHKRSPGREPVVGAEWLKELSRVIELDPNEVGVKSANWTTELLAKYLEAKTGQAFEQETVRRYLRRFGYVYKRPNWTVQHKAQEREGYLGNA